MAIRIPEIHPISDLARDARSLVERARRRQEPIVIAQRGREVAVLVPIELYRKRRFDWAKFRMEMTPIEPPKKSDAGI
ncbi:MAG: type II toxin-antitoxin system Phd/YefM family antitoxin [Chloroflexi bacterium]|nr:type II toxin-antitoxin system Phd/YefM family antitoxin [Chloroflexota bacterium]